MKGFRGMATYTVKMIKVCAGGEHVSMKIYRNGIEKKAIVLSKTELLNDEVEIESVLQFFIRHAIKSANASTNAQIKAAVEAMELTL